MGKNTHGRNSRVGGSGGSGRIHPAGWHPPPHISVAEEAQDTQKPSVLSVSDTCMPRGSQSVCVARDTNESSRSLFSSLLRLCVSIVMRTAADTHKASRTADESALRDLVASLSDTARTARAQQQLTELIRAGGAATVLGLLLDRLLGNEGVKGAGARRAVAKILEEAMGAAGVDGLSVLPKLVALAARVLGDGESTVRDSFSHALASAARSAGSNATGKELLALLIRPLLRVLVDGRRRCAGWRAGDARRRARARAAAAAPVRAAARRVAPQAPPHEQPPRPAGAPRVRGVALRGGARELRGAPRRFPRCRRPGRPLVPLAGAPRRRRPPRAARPPLPRRPLWARDGPLHVAAAAAQGEHGGAQV